MRTPSFIAAALALAATTSALVLPRDGGFTTVDPGTFKDLIVTEDNTLNGTYQGETKRVKPTKADFAIASTLPLSFVNNLGADISAYITGLDSNGAVCFILGDGTLVYPSSGGSAAPVPITENIKIPMTAGQELSFPLPITLTSGRIYFSQGDLTFGVVSTGSGEGLVQPAPENPTDPSTGLNWGFVELTLLDDGTIYANISYVDFVGLPLGMQLTVNGGDTQSAYGVDGGAVASICSALQGQTAADGRPWEKLCMAGGDGQPVRALAPTKYTSIDPNGFADYWDQYANDVWAKYTNQDLIIDTQNENGQIACRVAGDTLNCPGDNRGYNKPIAQDVWGCDGGPFGKLEGDNGVHLAVIPRLCSAFVRTTLLADGGDVQPNLGQDNYYKADPTNHYSRIVHEHETKDGKGYAFAYDDVNPNGSENASGTVSSGTPNTLTVYIGAPPA